MRDNPKRIFYLMLATYAMVFLEGFSGFAFNAIAWLITHHSVAPAAHGSIASAAE
ncbi:hypothetical protein ACEWPM_016800 [Roseovarius sp. S4756]|uniref:hypothetical protein n=1 Tax=Roseovarius maritimus TaxID=3342637 RepID=UPI00372781BD